MVGQALLKRSASAYLFVSYFPRFLAGLFLGCFFGSGFEVSEGCDFLRLFPTSCDFLRLSALIAVCLRFKRLQFGLR